MKNDIFEKISPDEALEILRQITKPFLQEMYRLLDLEMYQEAKLYCMGIAKGIYQYEEDSTSEFKDWAADVPVESYNDILNEWEKRGIDVKDKKEMRAFLGDACPNWS